MSGAADVLRTAAQDVIEAYKRLNPMRTADFHRSECDCFRCAMDNLQAALAYQENGK